MASNNSVACFIDCRTVAKRQIKEMKCFTKLTERVNRNKYINFIDFGDRWLYSVYGYLITARVDLNWLLALNNNRWHVFKFNYFVFIYYAESLMKWCCYAYFRLHPRWSGSNQCKCYKSYWFLNEVFFQCER